ncbi:MAG: hypothetical protein KAI66_18830 [Lentisphaeria bacterium]|nr:hypothetical protein [Lentisphaeria bacterium]
MKRHSSAHLPRKWRGAFLSVGIPLLLLAAMRSTIPAGHENSQDCFYHVTMADMGPGYFLARTMPHMTLSLWSTAFSDKEALFHVYLWGVRSVERAIGLATGPPFMLDWLLLAIGLLLAFHWALRASGAKHPAVWTLALVVLSPTFTSRLLMLRPHVLGMTLAILSAALFTGIRGKRDLWRPLAMGWLFAWSYSNPHFVLVVAAAFALPHWRDNRRLALLIPLVAAAGILLGYTFHPQFPNTFLNWKVQCIDVVLASLRGSEDILVGSELRRGSITTLLSNSALAAICAAAVAAGLLGIRRRRLSIPGVPLCALALFWTALVFVNPRAIEYACPFVVLAAAATLPSAARWLSRRTVRLHEWHVKAALALLLVCMGTFTTISTRRALRTAQARPFADFADWALEAKLPFGTIVANVNWSDFPPLFYSAPQFRYLAGLDPMFAAAAAPERVARLEAFRRGKLQLTPPELATLVGTRLAFVSSRGWQLARDMDRQGFRIVYQGEDGWLFDLATLPARQHGQHR